jgi:choline dehydrogenase-like flavoprotein
MDHPTMVPAHLYSEKEGLGNLTKAEEKRFIVPFFQLKEDVLREHKTTNIRIPLAPSNEFTMSDGISSYHILGEALSKGRVPEHFGAHIANFVSDFDMVIEAIARKKFDTELFDEAKAFSGYRVLAMMEQTPSRDNRVKLGKVKDRFGIAKVEIDWELKSNDIRMLWSSLSLFGQDMGGLSFGRLRLLNERAERIFTSQLGFGHHHMGTTRMAETYDKGVVDPNLRVFGTENLYVSGCSVFPTGGHVPPTLTIVALSIRLAEHLKKAK